MGARYTTLGSPEDTRKYDMMKSRSDLFSREARIKATHLESPSCGESGGWSVIDFTAELALPGTTVEIRSLACR